jgi:hypothetical protein
VVDFGWCDMFRCCFPARAQNRQVHPDFTKISPRKTKKPDPTKHVSPEPRPITSTKLITDTQALLNIHIEKYLMNIETTDYEKKYLIKQAMIDFLNNLDISNKKKIIKIQSTYRYHKVQLVIEVAHSITEKDLSSSPT